MGELIQGTPALRITTTASLPLGMVSILSLLYRAVPGSGLDPWLLAARRSLPKKVRANLDLLHGFSGRLLYYVEEPVMRFGPLARQHRSAGFDDLLAFLESMPPEEYLAMVVHALGRVRADHGLESDVAVPDDEEGWRALLEPGLTTASFDEVRPLLADPGLLKARTVRLFGDVWDLVFRDARAEANATIESAARIGRSASRGNPVSAFMELTGHCPPDGVLDQIDDLRTVTFCPSMHLGEYVSYIRRPPDLIVYYDAIAFLAREGEEPSPEPESPATTAADALATDGLLEVARALADPSRLRILDMLSEGELYAQEIVGRLGIAQSAVSRHMAQLERATLVEVNARRGLKYYSLNRRRFGELSDAFRQRSASRAGDS